VKRKAAKAQERLELQYDIVKALFICRTRWFSCIDH